MTTSEKVNCYSAVFPITNTWLCRHSL